MKKTYAMMMAALMLFSQVLPAKEVTKSGTTAAAFLNIDVGARAVGMGGAFVAVANDASAMFWNSSGIARLTTPQVLFNYTKWIADIDFNYVAAAFPLGKFGTVGANATFITMGAMERTTIANPDGTGELFDAGSLAFGLSYAANLTDRFSIGFNAKYIQEDIYHSRSTGIAFDVGTLFITQFNGLAIGMNISNYGTKMRMDGRDMLVQTDVDPIVSGNNANINANLQTDAYDLPLLFRVGISLDVLKGAANSNLILSADALHPNDDVEFLNIGGEYLFDRMFALRAGYSSLFSRDSEAGISLGGGINHSFGGIKLAMDYAFRDFGVLKEIHMFSVSLNF